MSKKWGSGEYWGLGSEFDPDWVLTESQKQIRDDLIDLCRRKIRPLAAEIDKNYIFPRESMNALAELGLLGLIVPKELGGRGENHVCLVMVVETLARYGCPSTAMIYTMHSYGVSDLLLRYHKNDEIRNLLSRLDKDKLIGTVMYSDPATGSHTWYHVSCKAKFLDENTIQVLKYGSWCTSAGHADFYTLIITSPDFKGDFANISHFFAYKPERAMTTGMPLECMHGNMSGPVVVEGKFNTNRVIGKIGEGTALDIEMMSFFMMCSAACWNGITMACMDVAKKHVTRKSHADVGMRVCDYVTIQDYFGDYIFETTSSRMQTFMFAQRLDQITNNCDWSLHEDPKYMPRSSVGHWSWMVKCKAAKNVYNVSDVMLQACGGTGYKVDLGLERLLRDCKAGWLMSVSNEVLRNLLGKIIFNGMDSIDFWHKTCNDRIMHHEVEKMSLEKKKAFAKNLLEEVAANEEGKVSTHPFQDTDFENPFNTSPPAVNDQIRATINDKEHSRYFSPVSRPDDFGLIELVLRYETQGIISQHFRELKLGDKVELQGPCGGFEYEPNKLDQVTLLTSGGGITPAVQLIRCVMKNPKDKTKIKLLHYTEEYDDIIFRKELDQYAAEDSRLEIVYAVGSVPEDWDGEEGHIDTQMIDKHVIKPNSLKHKIVMCGGATMAISCLYSLKALGFPSNYIFIYGQFGTELVRVVYGRNAKLSVHTCHDVKLVDE